MRKAPTAAAGFATALLLIILASSCGTAQTTSCSADVDCPAGHICNAGECRSGRGDGAGEGGWDGHGTEDRVEPINEHEPPWPDSGSSDSGARADRGDGNPATPDKAPTPEDAVDSSSRRDVGVAPEPRPEGRVGDLFPEPPPELSPDVPTGDQSLPDHGAGGEETGPVEVAPDIPPREADPPDNPGPPPPRTVVGAGAPLASIGPAGGLVYRRYSAQGETNAEHILPDYSFAGYMKGGVAIPTLPVRITVKPASGDDRARIQAAIDTVARRKPDSRGFRGAVQLVRGVYEVGDTLRIRVGGVVLRGAGQGTNGTVLKATKRSQHTLIELEGSGSGLGEIAGSRVRITTPLVPVGATSFQVKSTAKLAPGHSVAVLRTPNQQWIDSLGMKSYGWTTKAYSIVHQRTVVAVQGNRIYLDIPLVDAIQSNLGGGYVYRTATKGRIGHSGVEDLRLVSTYRSSTDEAHGWSGIALHRVVNCWVRRVTVEHFGYAAVTIRSESSFNTVEDTAMLDPISQITGSRRYSFNVSGGVGNLFQRCYSRNGRHNFVSGARVTGPHVWLDCLAVNNHSDDGPHHRWSTGLLFDNTSSSSLNVQNRTSSGTGHGWAGAQTLFWNAKAAGIICDAPRFAMNWSIGCVGTRKQGMWAPKEPYGWWESLGKAVKPRSLYLQQLEDRLGRKAVEAVTLPAQRSGRIWDKLAIWAGEGRLSGLFVGDPTCKKGVKAGTYCCAASCRTCGGTGCSQRPGGAAACCTGSIKQSGRSCKYNLPPCIM